jgi:hypothetical protein
MISRWKHANKTQHLLGWLQGFGELADGIVTVLSFGFFISRFEMTLCCWRAKLHIKQQIKAKQNIKDQ